MVQQLGDGVHDPKVLDERSTAYFSEIDTDGNGQIDATEMKAAMEKAGISLTAKELKAMMDEADEDGCVAARMLGPRRS
jgi:Ca2+-binding EF-hand superfamily protein